MRETTNPGPRPGLPAALHVALPLSPARRVDLHVTVPPSSHAETPEARAERCLLRLLEHRLLVRDAEDEVLLDASPAGLWPIPHGEAIGLELVLPPRAASLRIGESTRPLDPRRASARPLAITLR